MMYKKILIATDGSELAIRALVHGLKLAKELKVPVAVVTVTPMWSALEIAHEKRGSPRPIRLNATRNRQRHGPKGIWNQPTSKRRWLASASSSFTCQKALPPKGSSQWLRSRVAISS